jgi:hypothetical protein
MLHQVNAWAKRALPNEGTDTFRVDLVDEGIVRLHRYTTTAGKIRAPLESYTQDITGVEMPDPRWFDR